MNFELHSNNEQHRKNYICTMKFWSILHSQRNWTYTFNCILQLSASTLVKVTKIAFLELFLLSLEGKRSRRIFVSLFMRVKILSMLPDDGHLDF